MAATVTGVGRRPGGGADGPVGERGAAAGGGTGAVRRPGLPAGRGGRPELGRWGYPAVAASSDFRTFGAFFSRNFAISSSSRRLSSRMPAHSFSPSVLASTIADR
jgi:hypothetical protein